MSRNEREAGRDKERKKERTTGTERKRKPETAYAFDLCRELRILPMETYARNSSCCSAIPWSFLKSTSKP
jgi:hypothetical protein